MKPRKEDSWIVLALVILLFLPVVLYRAMLLSYLWVWFITPVFGLTVPSLWLLAGLFATLTYIKGTTNDPDKTEYSWTEFLSRVVSSDFIYPTICFGLAWVIALLGGLL